MKIGLQTWGSEGDVQPFTALAAGLVKAGHDVTLAITDNVGRDYGELGRKYGYRIITAPLPQPPGEAEVERIWQTIIELGNPIRQAEVVLKYGFDPAVEEMYRAATALCEENDAVIGHFFVYPLRVAAAKRGVPVATVNVVHNCIPTATICPPGFPDLGRWSYPLAWRLVRHAVNRIFLPRVNALRRREGLAPDRDVMLDTWASPRLNLLGVSRAICQRPADWAEQHHVCGFFRAPAVTGTDRLPEGLLDFLSQGPPPVYITFGSMMLKSSSYVRETVGIWIEAVQRAGCRAILQIPYEDLASFQTGESIFKVRRTPYREVFPDCSMIVHHGGAGTTQSALEAGKPMIIVAHVADQFFWGAELERLGCAGKTLGRKGFRAVDLAGGIQSVLAAPEMARNAADLGRQMAMEDGVSEAVKLIEQKLLP